jgi:putative transposase
LRIFDHGVLTLESCLTPGKYQGTALAVPIRSKRWALAPDNPMALPKRNSKPENIFSDSRTFFLTSECWERRQLFKVEAKALLLIDVMLHYRDAGKFLLHEFTVMPEHFHVLLTFDSSMSIEKGTQFIKGNFSYRVKRELGSNLEIWQRGSSETRIYDELSYLNHRDYIHQNAVKRGLVSAPDEYLYCSANGKWHLDPNPFAAGAKAHHN